MRDPRMDVVDAIDTPFGPAPFAQMPRRDIELETGSPARPQRQGSPWYSRSYFVPMPGGLGHEVIDVCLPVQRSGRLVGFMTATFALSRLLDEVVGAEIARHHELSFVEATARGSRTPATCVAAEPTSPSASSNCRERRCRCGWTATPGAQV